MTGLRKEILHELTCGQFKTNMQTTNQLLYNYE